MENCNSTYIFDGIMPLRKFEYGNQVCLITLTPSEIFAKTCYSCCSSFISDGIMSLWKFLVGKSCSLSNSESLWDIFTKFNTSKTCYHTICRDQRPLLLLNFWWSYAPLKLLVGKLCPLNNSEILWDIFAKLDTNIKHNQMMYRDEEP